MKAWKEVVVPYGYFETTALSRGLFEIPLISPTTSVGSSSYVDRKLSTSNKRALNLELYLLALHLEHNRF